MMTDRPGQPAARFLLLAAGALLLCGMLIGAAGMLVALLLTRVGFIGAAPLTGYAAAALMLAAAIHALVVSAMIWSGRNLLNLRRYALNRLPYLHCAIRVMAFLRFFPDGAVRALVEANNALVRICRAGRGRGQTLLLLPRCLQHSSCGQLIVEDISLCKGCGRCDIAGIVKNGYTTSCVVRVATGGEIAKRFVREQRPELVIAVACSREIIEGFAEVSGLPVYAILNEQPEGPCRNTRVSAQQLAEAFAVYTGHSGEKV